MFLLSLVSAISTCPIEIDLDRRHILLVHHICRVHKPGVPRGPASTPGLGLRKQHVAHGMAQKPKNTMGWKDILVLDQKVYPKEQNARSSTSSAHLSDRSTRFGQQPPPGGLFDRKAWPKTMPPTPTPRFRPGVRRKPGCRSSPTGATRTNWGHPTTVARLEGTRGERKRQRISQTTIPGTIPYTPAGTVLHNRSDANNIVGANICAYSIAGTIRAPIWQKAPHASRHQ